MSNVKAANTPEASTIKLSKDQCPDTPEEIQSMIDVPYRGAVGSLLYATLGTRPDIAHAVNEISRYMENPGETHWIATKRIMRYLCGTIDLGLVYRATTDGKFQDKVNAINIIAYSDSDWAGDRDDRKSTTGYVIKLNKSTISWLSKKQKTIALSSAEAEYMAICATAQEVMWLRQLLSEILPRTQPMSSTVIYTDNQAAQAISKNDTFHDRTKHIDIRHHFVRDGIRAGLYHVDWIPTTKQLADIFTKGTLTTVDFVKFRDLVMRQP
jgi:hypothetical protein